MMMVMSRPPHPQQAGLLLRSLGAGGGARSGAMKTATSLLLGAALATAFFLLYTSLARDLGTGPAGSPPRFEQGTGTAAPRADRQEMPPGQLVEPKPEQEQAAKGDARKPVGRDADGRGAGAGARTEEKGKSEKQEQQRIVMPATSSTQQQQQQEKSQSPPTSQDLADLLRRAATPDKTVLITAINDAWASPGSFLDLFLDSFRHGEDTADLPQHLLIITMDAHAFRRCTTLHPFCYWFRVPGLNFTAEQKYMKGDYLEMMWRRNRLQQTVLELGYSFLFTDVDILWLRRPFPRLPPAAAAQVVMSADFFVGDVNSPGNYPNGGLLYVRASPATVGFYRHWQASRARFPGHHEQYVFDKIVKEGSAGVRVQFLDTAVFGGFCQHGDDLGKVATMHANCCVGLENKLFDLKNVLRDWKEYRARAKAGNAQGFSWRVPGRCIH